jgi:hypothetical protein
MVSGAVVMMFYVGSQESIAYFWGPYIQSIKPTASRGAFWDLTIAHVLFAASRFIAAGMCYVGFTPRLILNICLTGTFLTTLLAVVLPAGNGAYVCVLLALFFEGPVFPTLFATALRGQGRRTKHVSIAATVAIGFAVIWQSSTWAIYQRTTNIRTAFILIAVMCGIQALWPLALDASSVLRRVVDPKWSLEVRRPAGRQSIASLKIPLGLIDEKDFEGQAEHKPRDKHVHGLDSPTVVTIKPRSNSGQSGSSSGGECVDATCPAATHHNMPVLARVPEETGPTDSFAGIGVVGELPEIE